MTENSSHPPKSSTNEAPLESWKEIAAHLKRDVSTLKRWEKSEGLPVRRHLHQARSTVYAYPSELDAWWAKRRPAEEPAEPGWLWRRPARVFAFSVMMLMTLVSAGDGRLLGLASTAAQGPDVVVRRVWSGPGVDFLGVPTADGRFLTFVDWNTGDLALRDLTSGTNRRLTNKGTWFDSAEYAEVSVISPDGKQIAYAWFNKDFFYELRTIGMDGSEPRAVFRNKEVSYLQPAAWTPDGKHVLLTLARTDGSNQIGLVRIADGSLRALKTLDWRWPEKLSLSPDGRYVVYDFPPQEEKPERDLFLLATDGSLETPLVQGPADDTHPVWLPEGDRVLFVSDRTGSRGAWAIRVADGKPQGDPQMAKSDIGHIFPMGFTGHSTFFYGLNTGVTDVYLAQLDVATGTPLAPPTKIVRRYLGQNTRPDWSPDGRYLAFASQRGFPVEGRGSAMALVIVDARTNQERELNCNVRFHPIVSRLRWAPDGRSVFLTAQDRRNRWGIYQVDVQTGEVSRVVQAPPEHAIREIAALPDGKALLYVLAQAGRRLILRDIASGEEKELLRGPAYSISNLALAPDGNFVSFRWWEPAAPSDVLRVMPVAGGAPRELVRVTHPEVIPLHSGMAWTADGRNILYVKSRSVPVAAGQREDAELWLVSTETGKEHKLGPAMPKLRGLSLAPDGQRLAFSAGEFSAEVWAMENLSPKPSGAVRAGK